MVQFNCFVSLFFHITNKMQVYALVKSLLSPPTHTHNLAGCQPMQTNSRLQKGSLCLETCQAMVSFKYTIIVEMSYGEIFKGPYCIFHTINSKHFQLMNSTRRMVCDCVLFKTSRSYITLASGERTRVTEE